MVIWEYHSKAHYIICETLRKVTHNPETGQGLNIQFLSANSSIPPLIGTLLRFLLFIHFMQNMITKL